MRSVCASRPALPALFRLGRDQTVIEESRPKDWEPRLGSRGGMPFGQSRQHPTDRPLLLFRRRFDVRSGPNKVLELSQSGAGILVWAEPDVSDGH
ncbi:hypothetical protein Q31b_55630 [Novipirellula aureliae]|uniref:Uncharacterized protein n=1 Tax=Novipirellula aureliae TaxID=2527966 RepID=A0A5C6DB65_9BACT|nr:hypothetical protein Q31b_55630 [Novipirellula aureliae]